MRLFKKAAVCLLAAAMAVSMLTACGDDGPSNPGNGGNGGSTGGGNTSTSTPAKPDEGNSGNTSGGSEENGASTNTVAWLASKTYKYNKLFQGNKLYMSVNFRMADDSSTQVMDYVYNQSGIETYVKLTEKNTTISALLTSDNWAYVTYPEGLIVSGKKIGAKMKSDDFEQQKLSDSLTKNKVMIGVLLTPNNSSAIKTEKKVLSGVAYDTEKYDVTYNGITVPVTCYYLNGKLVYIIGENGTSQLKLRFDDLSNTPKAGLLKPDSEYVFYSVDQHGNVYDENNRLLGNIYG